MTELDLGSDHRAVKMCLEVQAEEDYTDKRKDKRITDWLAFANAAGTRQTACTVAEDVRGLENVLLDIANLAKREDRPPPPKREWDSVELRTLQSRRRDSHGEERTQLSKAIWRLTRQQPQQ